MKLYIVHGTSYINHKVMNAKLRSCALYMVHCTLLIITLALSACSNETLDIGSTLTDQTDRLSVSSADYNVSTKTVLADSILLRSSYCCLGRVKDPETRAYITSEFMTQFNIMETFALPDKSQIVRQYNGMAAADSCCIELYMSSPTGNCDSLAAMKIRISELGRPMEENRKYYSNFDPKAEGYVREGGLSRDKMFTYDDLTLPDSALIGYYNSVDINMNVPYTDRNGVTYNNYGTYLMQQYYQHPEYFKNSYSFIHNVCPGFYFSVLDGEGFYTNIPEMCIRVYYRYQQKDSIIEAGITLAGTEEVLQTTKISNEKEFLEKLTNDNTCTYIKAPAGLYTEVTLPIDDIYSGHDNDSIMTAKINFQRINNDYEDEAFKVPNYMLMVPKDSLSTFFEEKKTPDYRTTFYATYQSGINIYSFSNISSLVTKMANSKRNGLKADNQWVAKHPDWNKVLLVPVQIITSSTSTTTSGASSFEHCAGLVSTKLVGGAANPLDPIKLSIVYGKFND